MSERTEFEWSVDFPLDPFQTKAIEALDAGRSVLVAAPTGSGKTLIAEYAIARARAKGGKTFYTTPIKALSNQKFVDLRRIHGDDNVGLLTGDNAVNGEAPVVVMTTEVLRNMLYADSPTLAGLQIVVLDEVHYLGNPYRGAVWEEVIIHLAPEVDVVCLSATVSNAEELADWIQTVRGDTETIIEERRPVNLEHRYLVGDRNASELHLLPTFLTRAQGGSHLAALRPNPEAARLDARSQRTSNRYGRPGGRFFTPRRVEVIERLGDEHMLPSIYFIFSRAGCSQAVEQCLAAGVNLTKPAERKAIREIAESKVTALSDDDLRVLGYGDWLAGMEAGIAAHHAGMVPPMKEAVEQAFTDGLVKVVFATETLALGINMPARSVVIEKLSKFTGERHEVLTPGEYTQLTGRAGRRGIDEIGYAVVLWSPFMPFDQVAGLASTRASALTSSFRPTYNMAANLVSRYRPETAHHLLNLSFAQYRTDTEVVRLERRLARLAVEIKQAGKGTPRAKQLGRQMERLERSIRGRAESLARQFDRVLRVLGAWDYVEDWTLGEWGHVLAGLYAECDLLIAQCLRDDLFTDLRPPELCALVSCFVYETRGSAGRGAGRRGAGRRVSTTVRWPTRTLATRFQKVIRIWKELSAAEREAGLPETREPDPGFAAYAYEWAKGHDLDDVLGDEELTGGDFVRTAKQLIDLLRGLGDVAPDGETSAAARSAADALFRGVIAASSTVGA